jgi:hypothetical protein
MMGMEADVFRGYGIEITIAKPSDFLVIKETLTRIGVAARDADVLYQSCHILHKRGRYSIIHFKELYAMDGRKTTIDDDDISRRNRIAALLEEWGLLKIVYPESVDIQIPITHIKILNYKEKPDWILEAKYKNAFWDKKK